MSSILRKARTWAALLVTGLAVFVASCGGGSSSNATTYTSVAMAGELVNYTVDLKDIRQGGRLRAADRRRLCRARRQASLSPCICDDSPGRLPPRAANGGLGERFNPAVLKTAGPQGPVSSNLTASARFTRESAPLRANTVHIRIDGVGLWV